jgi:hypothetical protein
MHQASALQFARIVDEFVRWREVPEAERSPAPAWWWGPALEVLGVQIRLPAGHCTGLGLSDGATYADGAQVLLKSLAGQTLMPWPSGFPGKAGCPDAA